MDLAFVFDAERNFHLQSDVPGVLSTGPVPVAHLLLLPPAGHDQSIPAATERYQECHQERLPALHDGHAGHDLHIHLLDYRFYLPLRHFLQ